jgi:hypothetical protein
MVADQAGETQPPKERTVDPRPARVHVDSATKKRGKPGINKPKAVASKKPRGQRPFPATSFEDSLTIANAIQELGGDRRVRQITVFEHLKKSPDSGPSRQMVTNSGAYGITTGGYQADHIELTDDGAAATNPEGSVADRFKARFKLAIQGIELFNSIHTRYAGGKLPASVVIRDFLKENGVQEQWLDECVALFTVNAKFVGILREIAGAERLLKFDHALEEAIKSQPGSDATAIISVAARVVVAGEHWSRKCFYLTPIGEEGSEERLHADLFMGSLIEPAIEPLGLEVVRSDQIGEPGMIASHILQHLKNCRLAIADMSHRNPNVFYEMAIRHVARLPLVQIIRKADRLPFDINQVRTVVIDTTDIYSLIPKLDVYRSEIQTQARRALEDPAAVGNPITVFYPECFA